MTKAQFILLNAKLLISVQFRRTWKEFIFVPIHVLHRLLLEPAINKMHEGKKWTFKN
jgi:hypothetical protein